MRHVPPSNGYDQSIRLRRRCVKRLHKEMWDFNFICDQTGVLLQRIHFGRMLRATRTHHNPYRALIFHSISFSLLMPVTSSLVVMDRTPASMNPSRMNWYFA